MTEKRSKYDTDPLDPDFVRGTEEIGGATRGVGRTPSEDARRDPHADDPTRRFYEPPPQAATVQPQPETEQFSSSYPSVFVPPTYQPPPAGYTSFGADMPQAQQPAQPQPSVPHLKPSQRPIQKLGIPENFALVLPYAPFFIGLVASLVELILVPRTETRTRFHAAQGLALQLVILAGTFVFNIVEMITDNGLGGSLLWLASTIFLFISMWRVWEGKPHHIPPLDDLTKKINERFEPRK